MANCIHMQYDYRNRCGSHICNQRHQIILQNDNIQRTSDLKARFPNIFKSIVIPIRCGNTYADSYHTRTNRKCGGNFSWKQIWQSLRNAPQIK